LFKNEPELFDDCGVSVSAGKEEEKLNVAKARPTTSSAGGRNDGLA
jgi:hypothetical protein